MLELIISYKITIIKNILKKLIMQELFLLVK